VEKQKAVAECDRLKEINKELVEVLKDAVAVIGKLADEIVSNPDHNKALAAEAELCQRKVRAAFND